MKPKTQTTTVSLAVVGVDIGKEVFHLVRLGQGDFPLPEPVRGAIMAQTRRESGEMSA